MNRRARIAIIFGKMPGVPAGGSEAVGAWITEALMDDHQVTIVTADPTLSFSELNDFFGTNLGRGDVQLIVAPIPSALRRTGKFRFLKEHLLVRYCKQIASEFDLMISSFGEADLGGRGIQYVHYPMALTRRANRGLLREVYERLCETVSAFSLEAMRANLTLTNSAWTAENIRQIYELDPVVLHPPIPDDFPLASWESREDGFLCIGRIVPEKRLEYVIRILRTVRKQGADVHLHLIGEIQDQQYWSYLAPLLEREKSWISVEGRLSRPDLVKFIGSHKYGLHGMSDEHFGIAIGEMMKGGCIVFVPNGGGQLEIVDDERLAFADEADCVDKICRVLERKELRLAVRTRLAQSSERFSPVFFAEGVKKAVGNFLTVDPSPS